MKLWYEVEFRVYHYNSGAADNGTFTHSQEFTTERDAREFINKLNGDSVFRDKVVDDTGIYDGFFIQVSGMKCYTEHNLELGEMPSFGL